MTNGEGQPDIDVSLAKEPEIAELVPLFDAYRQFYGCPSDELAARAFLESRVTRSESIVLIARGAPSRRIVGFAQLYPSFSSVRLAPTLVLNDLFVASEARRRGVADRLIEAVVEHARARGAVRIELETRPDNTAALALYRARGFDVEKDFLHLALTLPNLVGFNPL